MILMDKNQCCFSRKTITCATYCLGIKIEVIKLLIKILFLVRVYRNFVSSLLHLFFWGGESLFSVNIVAGEV